MINDECDVIKCKNKAIYEMEEKNGEIVFVCEEHKIDKDYCDNCEEYIYQIDLGNGSFGCPICKRDDCITTFYESEEKE